MNMAATQIFKASAHLAWVAPRYLCKESYFRGVRILLYCSVLSLDGKVNTRRISQPDMGSIFTKKNYEIFWSEETIM